MNKITGQHLLRDFFQSNYEEKVQEEIKHMHYFTPSTLSTLNSTIEFFPSKGCTCNYI